MKLETERLYIVPCTEERIQVANEQGYNSGPHIVGHVKNVKKMQLYYHGGVVCSSKRRR